MMMMEVTTTAFLMAGCSLLECLALLCFLCFDIHKQEVRIT